MRRLHVSVIALALVVVAHAVKPVAAPQWQSLFDGKTTNGWRGFQMQSMPPDWKVVDGTLALAPDAAPSRHHADIVTTGEYGDFELSLEWKIAPGGNSGVYYRAIENPQDTQLWYVAPEYQLIDAAGFKGKLKPTQLCAANYDLNPPQRDATRPAGSWNTTRIVAKGAHVEHWLNDQLIVSYELWTDEWKALVAKSKFADHPRYGLARRGHIALQDHGDAVSFRNIRIRDL
jgi:3-keto-disaccharide hydrolase